MLYNERKVQKGSAERIQISNYPDEETAQQYLQHRIEVLETYARFNERISKPGAHFSLSFHPSETIPDAQLRTLASEFLQEIQYGKQPYLVYRHDDTNHPHIHIVTVSVDINGDKISDSFLKQRINSTRQQLEIRHGLVRAEEARLSKKVQKSTFQLEAKAELSEAVRRLYEEYGYSSLEEFSQLLRANRIQLNRVGGSQEGKPLRGLTYQLTDGEKPISPPIKASALPFTPTLDKLEKQFKSNGSRKEQGVAEIRQTLKTALASQTLSSNKELKEVLFKQRIDLIDHTQDYFYLDRQRKLIYSANDLGKAYTKDGLTNLFNKTDKPQATLTREEAKALAARVSYHYRQFRENNPLTFESQVAEHFPNTYLVECIRAEGYPGEIAEVAVNSFERHKLSQITNLKEQRDVEQRNSEELNWVDVLGNTSELFTLIDEATDTRRQKPMYSQKLKNTGSRKRPRQ
ncbi:relaxase/mobilization nuclease domain-containing protein [Nibrella saemangeumensis]|uniref:relaxase/mobilization nuclease domain-containing protein n=1 Tax=Nibrella saemangeumensis TaxID=1084526 RepID=UPI0031F10525